MLLCVLALVILNAASSEEAAAGATETSGSGSRADEYAGPLSGQSRGRIELEVQRGPGGGRKVGIDVRRLDYHCEFGTRPTHFGLLADEVTANGRFEGLLAVGTTDSETHIELSLVEGRLLPDGRARGYVFSYYDPIDPGSDGPNQSECSSDGKVRWQARRVDHADAQRVRRPAGARAPRASGHKRPTPGERYEGTEGPNSISFEVAGGPRGKRVNFESEVTLVCDDPGRVETIGPIRARLDKDGRFSQSLYTETREPRRRFFTWVRGEILPGGKAKGLIAYIDDPWDPVGRFNEPECTAGPYLNWEATRVAGADAK